MGRNRATDASEADLVEAAGRGERDALEELLARHFDLVHAICRRVLWRPRHADALEQARLSLELMMQVRSRLLEGYQEIMRMQL